MIGTQHILALIPARGGSKGIPHKNIIDLNGRPLIDYTIQAARASRYIDDVVVSTDDAEIAAVAQRTGADVPFLRPAELASDTSKTIDAVMHALRALKSLGRTYDILVLLQPTAPLRTARDIDSAIDLFAANEGMALASVSPVMDHPILIRTIQDGRLKRLLDQPSTVRRQDMPSYYRVNGSIYINAIAELSASTSFNDNPLAFVMDRAHALDIDEPIDLEIARLILSRSEREQV